MKKIREHAAEILTVLGCECIVYGLARWSVTVAVITAGVMLIIFGVLIAMNDAKEKAKNAIAE